MVEFIRLVCPLAWDWWGILFIIVLLHKVVISVWKSYFGILLLGLIGSFQAFENERRKKKSLYILYCISCLCWFISCWVSLCMPCNVICYNKQVFISSASSMKVKEINAYYIQWSCSGDGTWKHDMFLMGRFFLQILINVLHLMTYLFLHTCPKYLLSSQQKNVLWMQMSHLTVKFIRNKRF